MPSPYRGSPTMPYSGCGLSLSKVFRATSPELIADKLSAAGWTWEYCSAVTRDGWRWIVDAHRDGRRYIVESDERLSAFLELERRSCNPGK